MDDKEVFNQLFTQLFEKVGEEIRNKSIKPCAQYMAEHLFPKTFGDKTYIRYHIRYVKNEHTVVGEPSINQLNLIAQYLEFKSYAEFESKVKGEGEVIAVNESEIQNGNDSNEVVNKKKQEIPDQEGNSKTVITDKTSEVKKEKIQDDNNRNRKYLLLVLLLLIFGLITFFLYDKFYNNEVKLCVYWIDDHYEKMPCENEGDWNEGVQINIENQWINYSDKRKITFEINQSFCDENGATIIWYSLTKSGYDFFNFSGINPTTGQLLKPVTQEFVDMYFADEKEESEDDSSDLNLSNSFDQPTNVPDTNPTGESQLISICETNNTGTICLKNLSNQSIQIRLKPVNGDANSTIEVNLKNVERTCLENFNATNYTYTVYLAGTNQLIEQSTFSLLQCQTKTLNIDVPVEEKEEAELPKEVPKPSKCETKELGDYCFTNNSSQLLHIIISDYSPTSPLSQRYLNLDLDAGQRGCYYDVPYGAYNVEYYIGKMPINSKKMKVKIKICEEGHTVLKY